MKSKYALLLLSAGFALNACNEEKLDEIINDTVNNSTGIVLSRADHPKLKYTALLVKRPEDPPRWDYTVKVYGSDDSCEEEFCKELYEGAGMVGSFDAAQVPWMRVLNAPEADAQACKQTLFPSADEDKRACGGDSLTVWHKTQVYAFDEDSDLSALDDLKTIVDTMFRNAKSEDAEAKLGTEALPYPLPW